MEHNNNIDCLHLKAFAIHYIKNYFARNMYFFNF